MLIRQTACDFVLIPKMDASNNPVPVKCTVVPVAVCCKPKVAKVQHHYYEDKDKSKDEDEYKPKKKYGDDDDEYADEEKDADNKYKKYEEEEDEDDYKPKKSTKNKSKKAKKHYEPKYDDTDDEADADDEEYYDKTYDEYAEAKTKQGADAAAEGPEGAVVAGEVKSEVKKPVAAKNVVTLPTPNKAGKPAAKPRAFAWILPRQAAAAAAKEN
jgi:hypothetical protein